MGKRYSDLLLPNEPFPQKPYGFSHELLTPGDQFVVDYCERAERLKFSLNPERMISEMITLDLSDRMLGRLAYEIWREAGTSEAEPEMTAHVRQAVESRITTAMRRWADEMITPPAAADLWFNIPTNSRRFGSPRDRAPYPIRNTVHEHEKEFFGMEAPLVLKPYSRQPRDDSTMRLVRHLEREVWTVVVTGLNSTVVTELASELNLTTNISHYASMFLAWDMLRLRWEEDVGGYDALSLFNAMEQRVRRRKLGALVRTY